MTTDRFAHVADDYKMSPEEILKNGLYRLFKGQAPLAAQAVTHLKLGEVLAKSFDLPVVVQPSADIRAGLELRVDGFLDVLYVTKRGQLDHACNVGQEVDWAALAIDPPHLNVNRQQTFNHPLLFLSATMFDTAYQHGLAVKYSMHLGHVAREIFHLVQRHDPGLSPDFIEKILAGPVTKYADGKFRRQVQALLTYADQPLLTDLKAQGWHSLYVYNWLVGLEPEVALRRRQALDAYPLLYQLLPHGFTEVIDRGASLRDALLAAFAQNRYAMGGDTIKTQPTKVLRSFQQPWYKDLALHNSARQPWLIGTASRNFYADLFNVLTWLPEHKLPTKREELSPLVDFVSTCTQDLAPPVVRALVLKLVALAEKMGWADAGELIHQEARGVQVWFHEVVGKGVLGPALLAQPAPSDTAGAGAEPVAYGRFYGQLMAAMDPHEVLSLARTFATTGAMSWYAALAAINHPDDPAKRWQPLAPGYGLAGGGGCLPLTTIDQVKTLGELQNNCLQFYKSQIDVQAALLVVVLNPALWRTLGLPSGPLDLATTDAALARLLALPEGITRHDLITGQLLVCQRYQANQLVVSRGQLRGFENGDPPAGAEDLFQAYLEQVTAAGLIRADLESLMRLQNKPAHWPYAAVDFTNAAACQQAFVAAKCHLPQEAVPARDVHAWLAGYGLYLRDVARPMLNRQPANHAMLWGNLPQ